MAAPYGSPEEAVFDILKEDATLKTLTGATVADSRVYREYPGDEVEVSATYPGYIIFSNEDTPSVGGTSYGEDQLWQAVIVATDPDRRDQIARRCRAVVIANFDAQSGVAFSDSRVHLGGGRPIESGRRRDDALGGYAVNLRFTLQTVKF